MLDLSVFLLASALMQSPDAAAFMRQAYDVTDYDAALVDLNDDGAEEVVIRARSGGHCGSGGCTLFILSPDGDSFKVVMRATVTQPPVRVLDAQTNGWRDVAVTVAGGGVTEPYEARLRFDGRAYPGNPTTPPAEPVAPPGEAGRILIPR